MTLGLRKERWALGSQPLLHTCTSSSDIQASSSSVQESKILSLSVEYLSFVLLCCCVPALLRWAWPSACRGQNDVEPLHTAN